MRRRVLGIMAVLVVGACGHTKAVEPTPVAPTPPPTASTAPAEKPREAAPAHEAAASGGSAALPTSPGGVLKPGAIKMIQQRLAISGALSEEQTSGALDAPTHAAIEKFQKANDLPATGDPDGATVVKLGLKPAEIFESDKETSALGAK